MLSMTSLGSRGRFGNQMFQYAALKGIARHRGFDFCIPPSNSANELTDHKLLEAFDLADVIVGAPPRRFPLLWRRRAKERSFRFDARLFDECPDNVDLWGYFQTEKYFLHIRDEILRDFAFRGVDDVVLPAGPFVSIHVRRGDYVEKQFAHPLCPPEYYRSAMGRFPPGTRFVVFSDDIAWCRSQEIFAGCGFSEGRGLIEDMYVMSRAEHNIVANSSFSWWAAWLNPNPDKIVVAPAVWFSPSYLAPDDVRDLVPDSWVRI